MKAAFIAVLLISMVSAAAAENHIFDIRPMDYQQSCGDTVKGLKKSSFVICDTSPERQPLKVAVNSSARGFAYPLAIKATSTSGKISQKPTPVATGDKGSTDSTVQSKFTVHFPFADFHVNKEQRLIIEEVISKVKGNDKAVDVEGFTCQLGSLSFNKKLALKRAKEVARVMKEGGVKVGKVSGQGKCCYISDENSENRRVELTIKESK